MCIRDRQDTVCSTWPPSLAKLLPHDGTAEDVADSSVSEEARILPHTVSNEGQCNVDNQSDHLSACSSDSFCTANDDSDFEYDVVADWPDGFDWQAVEPMFIYG